MVFIEEKENLFTYTCPIAHCISADYAMGAGIAVEVSKRYRVKQYLKENGDRKYPQCIFTSNVFNLVTKEKYWNKPTYESLRKALEIMKWQIVQLNIKEVAMPKIGCGLDRLQWGRVREIIKEVFQDVDITITVCHL